MNILQALLGIGGGNQHQMAGQAAHGAGIGAALGGQHQQQGFIPYADPVRAAQTVPHPDYSQGIPLTQLRHGLTFPNVQGPQYEDQALQSGAQGLVPTTSYMGNLQGSPQAQGGQYNPGYSPLQGTNSMGGGLNGIQPQGYMQGQGIQAFRHVNPQLRDTGYFWNQ